MNECFEGIVLNNRIMQKIASRSAMGGRRWLLFDKKCCSSLKKRLFKELKN